MDGSLALGIADVADLNTIFKITPTYYVNAYTNLKLGQVISTVGIIGDSLKLQFPPSKPVATVTLTENGVAYNLDIKYTA